VIRLREGEVNLLAGLVDEEKDKTISGWPGLGEVPILKYFFSTISTNKIDDEIVFMLIPHVVRAAQLTPLNLEQVDTGTTNAFELRLKPAVDGGAAPQNAPQNAPQTAPAAPGVPPAGGAGNGVMPGNTVAGAAANALAAMHQEANNPGLPVALQLVGPPVPPKVGTSFQVTVNLSGGHDVFSVPMQLQYDQNKMTLINVDSGSFLASDGQSVALVHRDDGSGGVAISASRPPGVGGVNGAGPVCILTFQAKAAGDAAISITRPGAKNSSQQSLPVTGSQTTVHIE